MRKKKIKELIAFIIDENNKVRKSIDKNRSNYDNHCWTVCLLREETLQHILYCIEEGINLKRYKDENKGNKTNWFGLS